MRARLRKLHADDGGFTVPELLVAMVVGLVVLMAAFLLIDRATSMSNTIVDRQDAAKRGRAAMERITTTVRSQVCMGENAQPITAGNQNGLTFYSNLTANFDAAQQRTLTYNPTTKAIVEEVRNGTGTYPDVAFPATPTRTDTLLASVIPMVESGVTQPVFRYYAYDVKAAPGTLTQLGVPLTPVDASRVVMIKVAFAARPDTKVPKSKDATPLQSDIYVRLADPTRPAEGPRCI